eukprot:Nitzschia sp. Nitz4//scaffold70_size99833//8392//9525//NITZ4_004583-RA/size99833-snap-gene-0.127-mRNA-1//1//CDS//3329557099//8338//frame0
MQVQNSAKSVNCMDFDRKNKPDAFAGIDLDAPGVSYKKVSNATASTTAAGAANDAGSIASSAVISLPPRHPPADFSRPLEFVHITKTGGTAIEASGAKAGILWGACHWRKTQLANLGCTGGDWRWTGVDKKEMPVGTTYRNEEWHSPWHWLKPSPRKEVVDTFAVVRNPYDRLISEFYCVYFGFGGDPTVKNFNTWLEKKLVEQATLRRLRAHMLPQHYYVYDIEGRKVVTHVLRYENLSEEFNALMIQYNLSARLLEKSSLTVFRTKNGDEETHRLMTKEDISPANKQFINTIYEKDFTLLGYEML